MFIYRQDIPSRVFDKTTSFISTSQKLLDDVMFIQDVRGSKYKYCPFKVNNLTGCYGRRLISLWGQASAKTFALTVLLA